MVEKQPRQPAVDVWMDGACGLCQSSKEWCEQRDDAGRVRFSDYHMLPDDQLPAPRSELESSMWLRDGDGKLWRGFDAWRRIVAELPGWRWLAWVTGPSPFRWFGSIVYDFIARHRHRFPSPGPDSGQPGAGTPSSRKRS